MKKNSKNRLEYNKYKTEMLKKEVLIMKDDKDGEDCGEGAKNFDNRKSETERHRGDVEYLIQKSVLQDLHFQTEREPKTREKIQKNRADFRRRRKRLVDNRVLVQLMSGQKIREKDLNPEFSDMSDYDFKKKISEINNGIKHPKIHFDNNWNDLTNKSTKYCKMLMTKRVIRNEEKLVKRLSSAGSRRAKRRARSMSKTDQYAGLIQVENARKPKSKAKVNKSFNFSATRNFNIENGVESIDPKKSNFLLRNGMKHPLKKNRERSKNLLMGTSRLSLNRTMRRKDYGPEKKEEMLNEYRRTRKSFLDQRVKSDRSRIYYSCREGRKTDTGAFADLTLFRSIITEGDETADFERLSKKSHLFYDDLEKVRKHLSGTNLADVSMERFHGLHKNKYLRFLYKNSELVRDYFKNSNVKKIQKLRRPNLKRLVIRPKKAKPFISSLEKMTMLPEEDKEAICDEIDQVTQHVERQRRASEGVVKGMNGRRFHNIYSRRKQVPDKYRYN